MLSVTFTLESEKTLENLKFKGDNNTRREDMSTGPGRRCLVSLYVLSLAVVKEGGHNRETGGGIKFIAAAPTLYMCDV